MITRNCADNLGIAGLLFIPTLVMICALSDLWFRRRKCRDPRRMSEREYEHLNQDRFTG